nr:protein PELPK1-like [Ipomoea batatas]
MARSIFTCSCIFILALISVTNPLKCYAARNLLQANMPSIPTQPTFPTIPGIPKFAMPPMPSFPSSFPKIPFPFFSPPPSKN